MNYKKFSHSYGRNGLVGVINVLLGKIGIKFRFKSLMELRIIWIANYIKHFTNNTVNTGLYKGMKIHNNTFWSQKDISTRLLGLYELEVQNIIQKIQSRFSPQSLSKVGSSDRSSILPFLVIFLMFPLV